MIDTNGKEESYSNDYVDHHFLEDSDDELIERFRDEARFWAAAADDSFRDYRFALKIGDGESAKKFDDAVKYFRKCRSEADDTAAEIAFERNNENLPFHIIDLHHLFVTQAIAKLTDRVNDAITNRMQELIVIVGRGHHSVHGPKLKTAVASIASKNNIRFSLDPFNPGRIKLRIDNASQIPLHETDTESQPDSSKYLYNRSKQVTLSEYITQSQLKKQRRQTSKNRKTASQRATDRPGNVSSSVMGSQQKTRSQKNMKQKERRRNAHNSNELTSLVNASQFEGKDSNLILQHGNKSENLESHLKQPSKNRKNAAQRQRTIDRPNVIASSANPSQFKQNNSIGITQHINGSVDLGLHLKKPSKNRKNASQRVMNRPNEMPPASAKTKTFQIEQKDTTHIVLNVNGSEIEFTVSISGFVFVVIGVMLLISKLCGF